MVEHHVANVKVAGSNLVSRSIVLLSIFISTAFAETCEGFFYISAMFQTYILYSQSDDQYYTGYTSVGVKKRLARHNDGSSSSTKSGIPWRIKYVKSFESKSEAIKWENFIKQQKSRTFIAKLIKSEDNEWE